MHSLAHNYPPTLRAEREAPHQPLYQSAHRQHFNTQDPVSFCNLGKLMATIYSL